MKVYALVGSSGTGKSYKALEVAYSNKINFIIDDGILVHKNKIIAGISAKKSNSIISAVKIAIFHNEEHRESVKDKIKEVNVDSILVIGTSNKMINQIRKALELPEFTKIINIKDICTEEEIQKALESRKGGNHIIPVPTVQIKRINRGLRINPLKKIRKRNQEQNKIEEKTIIRPSFSLRGSVYIDRDIIRQIVEYELKEEGQISKINLIDIIDQDDEISINININISDMYVIKNITNIQLKIKGCIEGITLINVSNVNIYINKLKKIRTLK